MQTDQTPPRPINTRPPLSAEDVHRIASTYISERYPLQLGIFQTRFPNPPSDPAAAHEIGFVTGMLLGLDIAAQIHTPGTSPEPAPRPDSARETLLALAN